MSEPHYDTVKVSKYYDTFSKYQSTSGINDRHAKIFWWLREFGLGKDDHILEIGCGVGQLTQLVAEYCRNGQMTAVDISPENIRLATERLKSFKHVELLVDDMMDAKLTKAYDWVVFPDVLEHIPTEKHSAIFSTVSDALKPGGHVFVHIPHPRYQDYIRDHEPEKLQIIDQSLSAGELINNAELGSLSLEHYQSYSLFRQPADYQAILFKKYDGVPVPKMKPYISRVMQRLRLRGFRS
jgi:trans-aconitate 2-methyltransferase